MIPIKYDSNSITEYHVVFYKIFRDKIRKWKKDGQISSKNTFDVETVMFLDYLLKNNNLKKLMDVNAEKIPAKIKLLQKNFPGLCDQKSIIMKNCRVIFISHGYDKHLPKDELIDDVGISVCPYCNRTFIHHVTDKRINPDGSVKDVDVKAQLDHFYDKSKYPYLAVSRENLVPCCSFCNEQGGKHTEDVGETHLVNPYTLKDSDGIKFKMDDNGSGLLSMKQLEEDLKIEIDVTNNPELQHNVDTFNLEKLYQKHNDYAAEMYKVHLFRQTDAYKQFIQDMVGDDSVGVTTEDIYRIITGTYSDPSDYNKRPLSKFRNDILEDLEDI